MAKEEASDNGSYGYTFEGLAKGTEYNLRLTITDNAGNSKTDDKTVSTKKRNESGTITDITTEEIVYPGQNSALITTNVGKTVDYTFTPKTATFSRDLSGSATSYTSNGSITWRVYAEDNEYLYLVGQGSSLTLKGINGFQNGVGLLDSICEYCYSDSDFSVRQVRNMKRLDIPGFSSGSEVELTREDDVTRQDTPKIYYYEGESPMYPTVADEDRQSGIYLGVVNCLQCHLKDPPIDAREIDKDWYSKIEVLGILSSRTTQYAGTSPNHSLGLLQLAANQIMINHVNLAAKVSSTTYNDYAGRANLLPVVILDKSNLIQLRDPERKVDIHIEIVT